MKSSFLFLLLFSSTAMSTVTPTAKTVFMTDSDTARVTVSLGRSTILSFPTRPSKVVLGNKDHFAVEYIENDLAISALHSQARCNLIVYLQGRRFTFDLVTASTKGDEILLIRDAVLKAPIKKSKWKSKRK
jgi:hypothetical protein